MILKTRQAGDPALRQKSKPVSSVALKSDKVQILIDAMIETLRDHPGVGLAAPQVGENLQIIVIEDLAKYHKHLSKDLVAEQGRRPVDLTVIVNPKLSMVGDATQSYFEGCLSIPGYRGIVERAAQVKVTGLDRTGSAIELTASGWFARVLQHEIEHLSGKLYIDRINTRSFISEKEYALHWANKLSAELAYFNKPN